MFNNTQLSILFLFLYAFFPFLFQQGLKPYSNKGSILAGHDTTSLSNGFFWQNIHPYSTNQKFESTVSSILPSVTKISSTSKQKFNHLNTAKTRMVKKNCTKLIFKLFNFQK